jgi:hypothetical protein
MPRLELLRRVARLLVHGQTHQACRVVFGTRPGGVLDFAGCVTSGFALVDPRIKNHIDRYARIAGYSPPDRIYPGLVPRERSAALLRVLTAEERPTRLSATSRGIHRGIHTPAADDQL